MKRGNFIACALAFLFLTISISAGQVQPADTTQAAPEPLPQKTMAVKEPMQQPYPGQPQQFAEPMPPKQGGFMPPPTTTGPAGGMGGMQQPPTAMQGAFQSNYGGLYQQPAEMKQYATDFQNLASPDLRPREMTKIGYAVAVTDRISPEKIVSGMIVERISEYFDQGELLKNCPDDGKITEKVTDFLNKNDYVLEDICWPVEDKVEDCKMEREYCEEIKNPETRGGFKFSCPAKEEDVEKECLAQGQQRITEETQRFSEEVPAMCEREWLMNEPVFTQMCQEKCDENRFLNECERQLQNAKERQAQQQMNPPMQPQMQQQPQWGERKEPMQQGMPGQPMQPLPEKAPPQGMPIEGQQPPPTTEPTPQPVPAEPQPVPIETQPTPLPAEPAPVTTAGGGGASETAPAPAPTGYIVAAYGTSTDCNKQLENFRQMCQQINTKSDQMCKKDSFISDCKERNGKQFDKEQMDKQLQQQCKKEAARTAVMLNRACRQMDHEYKKCAGRMEQACSSVQEQAKICNDLMTPEKVREAVSQKAKEFCKFSQYKTTPAKEEAAPDAQVPVAIAVRSDATESDITALEKLAGPVSESYSGGDVKVYKGTIDQQGYDELKKLDFVVDVKKYEFEKITEDKNIKGAVSVLEASKTNVPEDFRVWISNEESNLIDVNDKVGELTKPKGFAYGLKKAVGLAKEQELKEANELNQQSKKIDDTIKSLSDIASQTEDVAVKVALQEQIKQLNDQKDSFEKLSEERKSSAAGIFSIFGS